jgi:hypothetical protein
MTRLQHFRVAISNVKEAGTLVGMKLDPRVSEIIARYRVV